MGNLVSAPRQNSRIMYHGFHDAGDGSLRGFLEKLGDEAEANARLARLKHDRRRQRYEEEAQQRKQHGDCADYKKGMSRRDGPYMTGALNYFDPYTEPPGGSPYQDRQGHRQRSRNGFQDRSAFRTAPEQFDEADVEDDGYDDDSHPSQQYEGAQSRAEANYFGRGQNPQAAFAAAPRRRGRRRASGAP
ncbi:MAG: hypothetical protein Q9179_003855 [Wetmoreana sp. 5 TL-2023]